MKLIYTVLLVQLINASAFAWDVGHVTLTFEDASRGNRSIPCEVYYPSSAPGEAQPVFAPNGTEQYPVIVFGHGFLMPVDAYGYLQQALALNGFIGVFVDTETGVLPSHEEYAKDLAFAGLSMLNQNALATSLFQNRVMTAMAVAGHSMGGGSAMLAYQYNTSFKTVFTLGAAETNPSAVTAATGITVPTFYMAGENDCVTPVADHQLPMYNATAAACKWLVTLNGASHCQFADENFTCTLGELTCDPDITEPFQHDLVLDWMLPWMDLYLKNELTGIAAIEALAIATTGYTVLKTCDNLLSNGSLLINDIKINTTDNGDYEIHTNASYDYTMFSYDGKAVVQGKILPGYRRLELSHLPSGIYLMSLKNSGNAVAFKLVNCLNR